MKNYSVILIALLIYFQGPFEIDLLAQSPTDITIENTLNGSSSINFLESPDFGMKLRYDGSSNLFQVIPIETNNPEERPALTIRRDNRFVGIDDDLPVHSLSLGSSLGRTKFALYESSNNTSIYGMGVTAGQFNFNVNGAGAKYVFYDGPSSNAEKVFIIKGGGEILAPKLEAFGAGATMKYYAATGDIGHDTSSRRFKRKVKPLQDDWLKLLYVSPVSYNRPAAPDRIEYGYIAEEMDSIGLKNLVGYDENGLPYSISYDRVGLYLTEIIKIHHADLTAKQNEINLIKKELESIKDFIKADNLSHLKKESNRKNKRRNSRFLKN